MARTSTGAPSGRPPRVSRDAILEAAHALVERDGPEALTIRALAGRLGTSPATLYYHVRDKQELLVLMLGAYAEQLVDVDLPEDPRRRLEVAAGIMRDGLAARPWVAEVLTSDDLLGEAGIWFVEAIVGGGVELGLAPDDAVHLYRNIWYFTAGEVLVRARRTRRERADDRPTLRLETYGRLDPDRFPHLSGVAGRWQELTEADTYAAGLRALIDGAVDAVS